MLQGTAAMRPTWQMSAVRQPHGGAAWGQRCWPAHASWQLNGVRNVVASQTRASAEPCACLASCLMVTCGTQGGSMKGTKVTCGT